MKHEEVFLVQTPAMATDDQPELFISLAALARRLSTGVLVGLALCSWIAIALWTIPDDLPRAFPTPLLTIGMFGVWGLLQHVRAEYRGAHPAVVFGIKAGQKLAAVAGALSIFAGMFAMLGKMMGVFIL